jgi:hypothetical protein
MRKQLIWLLAVAACSIGGCAVPTKYYWGTYEPALYQYYKTPARLVDLEAELSRTIAQAGEKHQKVPPGVYAEYGFVLQQQGKGVEAAAYYQKEKQAWPESALLMDTMLRSLERGNTTKVNEKASQQ